MQGYRLLGGGANLDVEGVVQGFFVQSFAFADACVATPP
jgi:hypothetical protein